MERSISIAAILFGALLTSEIAVAEDETCKDDGGKIVTSSRNPKQEIVLGLVNMEAIMDDPLDSCSQMSGPIKVEGIQFSESGQTLETFWFTDKRGTRWVVPTNFDQMKLSSDERSKASDFIKTGKQYFVHIQVCGSGGFPSLVNMYAMSPFGSK